MQIHLEAKLRKQQMESEVDSRWLQQEENNLVCKFIDGRFLIFIKIIFFYRKIVSVSLHLALLTPKTDIYPETFHKALDSHHKTQYLDHRALANVHQLPHKQHSIHDRIHPVQIKEHYGHQIMLHLNGPQHRHRLTKS